MDLHRVRTLSIQFFNLLLKIYDQIQQTLQSPTCTITPRQRLINRKINFY